MVRSREHTPRPSSVRVEHARSRRPSDRTSSAPATSRRAAVPTPAARAGSAMRRQRRSASARAFAGRHEQSGAAVARSARECRRRRMATTGKPGGHRFEHGVGKRLGARRQHEDVRCRQARGDVVAVAEERRRRPSSPQRLRCVARSAVALAAVADDARTRVGNTAARTIAAASMRTSWPFSCRRLATMMTRAGAASAARRRREARSQPVGDDPDLAAGTRSSRSDRRRPCEFATILCAQA